MALDLPTSSTYERNAAAWQASRSPQQVEQARTLRQCAAESRPVLDAGCGPGFHADALAPGWVGFDASAAMLRLAQDNGHHAVVRADFEALPFRTTSFGAAWGRQSYVHVEPPRLPEALAELHRVLAVGAPIELRLFAGPLGWSSHVDALGERWFASWPTELLRDVVVGAGFDSIEMEEAEADDAKLTVRARRARTLADRVAPALRLLICGLNPSEYAADRGVAFARPGNRFWPAACEAGIVRRLRDVDHALQACGIGFTDLVKRASIAAAEVTQDEFRAGLARLERICAWLQPQAICVLGLTGWRAATGRPASAGWQDGQLGGRPIYLMANPSGLNAHANVASLAQSFREATETTRR